MLILSQQDRGLKQTKSIKKRVQLDSSFRFMTGVKCVFCLFNRALYNKTEVSNVTSFHEAGSTGF